MTLLVIQMCLDELLNTALPMRDIEAGREGDLVVSWCVQACIDSTEIMMSVWTAVRAAALALDQARLDTAPLIGYITSYHTLPI